MSEPLHIDPDAVCEQCGCPGAFRFETETLCGDCYAERGSSCACDYECEMENAAADEKDIPLDSPDAAPEEL